MQGNAEASATPSTVLRRFLVGAIQQDAHSLEAVASAEGVINSGKLPGRGQERPIDFGALRAAIEGAPHRLVMFAFNLLFSVCPSYFHLA